MKRKTKIICTLGPSTDDPAVLRQLMLAGMDVARINMSHQNQDCQRVRINQVKQMREELDLPVAVLIDTKGPEIRLGTFTEPKVALTEGSTFTLTTEPMEGTAEMASISFPGLPQDVRPGNHILIDDGLIDLEVQSTTETTIVCRVLNGGVISANKGINVPDVCLSMPFMSDRDRSDIAFACDIDADFIAASFTRCSNASSSDIEVTLRGRSRFFSSSASSSDSSGCLLSSFDIRRHSCSRMDS